MKLIKKHKVFLLIFLLFLIVKIFSLFVAHDIWWDSSVYVGMGKYIWSFGSIGLWEAGRPIFWPIVLGFFWRIGLDAMFCGFLLALIVSFFSIYLTYELIRHFSNRNCAAIFTIFFVLNLAFIRFSSKVLVDIPSMMFSLYAVYLILNEKNTFLAGVMVGLAVMTKFTHLLFAPILLIAIIIRNEDTVKDLLKFTLGAAIIVMPFLAFSFIAYGNPVYSFLEGNDLINRVVLNYSSSESIFFYLSNMLKENFLLVLSIIPLVLLFRKKDWKIITVAIALLVPLIYHSVFLHYKDIRYSVIFLPYLFVLAGNGYSILMRNRNKILRHLVVFIVIIQAVYSITAVYRDYSEAKNSGNGMFDDFYHYLGDKQANGKVWSTTPNIIIYKDIKIDELMYYPVIDDAKISSMDRKLEDNNIQYIFINSCDIPCVNYDADCPEKKQRLLDKISDRFRLRYFETKGGCELKIFENGKQNN